jgi:hypothetical protein
MKKEQNPDKQQKPALRVGDVSNRFFSLIFSTLENILKIL